jgi:DNA-binding NtrC family response regulator
VLKDLVTFMARRNAGDEADAFANEAYDWIVANLGEGYTWPGNYRELEQCVRNLMIRCEYRPAKVQIPPLAMEDPVFGAALQGTLTADELLRHYCTFIYAQTGSYEETSRRIQLDRRTVKSKVDKGLLDRIGRGAHQTSKA